MTHFGTILRVSARRSITFPLLMGETSIAKPGTEMTTRLVRSTSAVYAVRFIVSNALTEPNDTQERTAALRGRPLLRVVGLSQGVRSRR